MRTGTGNEEEAPAQVPFKKHLESAVRFELDAMLAAPIFSQSTRCKKFLRYVVLEALSGNAINLKERIIGINVFDRPNDYDTGDDSIVRVTANEVRKRIGQFYLESSGTHPVHIELPRGAYVPEFRLDTVTSRGLDPHVHQLASLAQPSSHSPRLGIETVTSEAIKDVPGPIELPSIPDDASTTPVPTPRKVHNRALWRIGSLLLIFLIGGITLWAVRIKHRAPDIWGPFKLTDIPVLICLGAHDIDPSNTNISTLDADRFPNLVLRKQVIPVDDAAVITNLGSQLGVQGISFRVTSADPTSLPELRRQPVILVGALDNKWTLHVSEGLPYRLERISPSGNNEVSKGSIIDSHDSSHRWSVDFGVPMSDWQHDYAIVARFDDSLTGVPMLLEGGLGNNGSLAASEFLSSYDLRDALAHEPACRGKSSFEAVIETEIVDAKPGPPHTLRIACW